MEMLSRVKIPVLWFGLFLIIWVISLSVTIIGYLEQTSRIEHFMGRGHLFMEEGPYLTVADSRTLEARVEALEITCTRPTQ